MTASPRALQRWAVRKIFLLILLGPALAGLALAATPRQEELDNFTRTFYLPKHFRGIAAEDAARALKYPRALADIFLDPTYAQKFAGPAEVENQLNLILNLIQGDKIRRNGILDFFNLQALEDHIIFRKAQIAWAYGRGIGARPEHFWAWQIIKAWLDPQRGTAHLTKFYQQVAALAAVGEMAMHYGPALPPPLAQYFLRQLATYLRHDDLGLRMMALSALSMLQGASAQALAHQTLRDPNWCRELSQKGNSKIGPILRFHFMGFALDAPAVRHNQDLLRDFYRLALDYFVFDECNYEFRIFAGEVAALEIAAATGTAGAQAMYNIALAHRDQSTEETYFSLSFQTSLLAYFNPDDDPSGAQNVLRQLQQLLQSPDAVEQILGAQAIIRHPFLEQQSIFAPQLRNLTWWQGVFAHLPSDIGSSFLLQKILRAMRFNPAGHTIQLLPELIMLHLKGTAGQAIRDHDYITLDETIFNLGNVLSRQKSLSFLTKILDGLLHWDGTWAGIKEDAATIKLNQSLAQLLGMAITTNLENPKTRQDCIDRMENYLKLKAAPDPYVQLMGLLLLERDPRPQAKAKLEFSLRHAKNIQQFFHAPSWWSSRGRFELFLRQYSFLLQREIPHTNHALAQRLAQDEETTGRRKNAGWAKTFKDAALPPAYPEEDRLNLSKPQHLALAKEIMQRTAQVTIFYLKSIIEQRQVESFTEQLRLTNFLSVMLGRSCHYREAIKFMLDYLLNQYHVSSFTPAAEHAQEEFLAKALGATLCDYYTHVKMERLELFQESMTVLLNSARPEYRFIGLYLITANADQRTANRDLFSMVLRPNWLKTYLLSDSKLAFPPLERLLTFGQRLYFAELSDLYQTLAVDRQIQKKLPTLFTHPFVGLKPHRLLEICNLDPSFNIGQALSKNKLNKEVPFRLAHQDLARAPETLAWLHLQDETWFNGPQVRQNIKEYFDKLFTHLISHAQNDELDVVKLNFTNSDWRLRTFMAAKFALVIHGLPEILEKDLTLQLIAHTQTLPEGVAKDAYATAVAHLLAHVHDPHWYFSQPPIIEFIDYLLAHQDTTMQALGLAPLWAQDDPRFNNHAFRLVGQKSWLQHFMHLDSSRHSLNTRWSILLNSLLVSEDDEATLLFEVALTTLLEQHLAEVEQGQSTKAPRRPKSVRFKDLVKEDICTAYLQPPSSAASAAAQISN